MSGKPQHGGAREGAGRKKGSNQYGETTKVIRVPESKSIHIKKWLTQITEQEKTLTQTNANKKEHQTTEAIKLPLYSHKVVAGFPSPADDYIEQRLDLNEKLIQNKTATFLLTVEGDSMKNIGILDGDILVVDKSILPTDGKIVIAALDGELTVKRLSIKSTGTFLVAENDNYPTIAVREESDIVIWGVVTSSVTQF
jgi:DNA polymerase V